MTIITWCQDQIQSAYKACKRVICFWKSEEFEFPEVNNNYNVQQLHISEQDPSPWPPSADDNSSPQQRRRPDIPTLKRRSVDPEIVAAVYKACKELRVPVGDDDDDIAIASKVQQ